MDRDIALSIKNTLASISVAMTALSIATVPVPDGNVVPDNDTRSVSEPEAELEQDPEPEPEPETRNK